MADVERKYKFRVGPCIYAHRGGQCPACGSHKSAEEVVSPSD
jgi:hypothetical protein